jgi:lambda family phage minor tail protein L
MTINADIQSLTPGNLIELYELDATSIGGGIVRFHGMPNSGDLTWQANVYALWQIKAEGFSRTSDQQPRPKLRVANENGAISLLCMLYDDMVGARLIRRRTFSKYLDAVNFPDGNPTADPTQEFPPEVWFVERKSAESYEGVEFELTSPLDFQGIKLPARLIVANYCGWEYRGPYCNYVGGPVATITNEPTSDPDLDNCSHTLTGCELRPWPDDILNFGGFAAAGLVRT